MALKNIYSINVDIKRRMTSVVPTFKQGDAATLKFRVYDDGVLLNLNNVNSEITFTLPNGETLIGNPELVNGELVYEFTGLEMSRPGKVTTILSIMRNNTMVSVPPFSCFIFDSMRGEALSYIGILQDLIKETQDLGLNFGGLAESVAESLELAEDQLEELQQVIQTTLADINTWDGNEQQRVSRENTRITNEQSRVSAETTRTQSENARANAENSRVQAETNRASTFNNQMQQTDTKINEMNVLIDNLESFDYSPSTTYDFPNLITYNGSTYMALKQVRGITPTNDKVNYRLIAQRGVDGVGSVSKVNGISPDVNGNVIIDVGDSEELNIHKNNSSPQKHINVVSSIPNDISNMGILVKVDGSSSDTPSMTTVDELNSNINQITEQLEETERKLDSVGKLSTDFENWTENNNQRFQDLESTALDMESFKKPNLPLTTKAVGYYHVMGGIDSHTAGSSGESYRHYFASRMRGDLGVGGTGYVPFTTLNGVDEFGSGQSSGFQLVSTQTPGTGYTLYSLDNKGIYVNGVLGSERYSHNLSLAVYDTVELFYLKQPNGGKFKVYYNEMESQTAVEVDTVHTEYDLGVVKLPYKRGSGAVVVQAVGTGGNLCIYGMFAKRDKGFIYSLIGGGGAPLAAFSVLSPIFRKKWLDILKPDSFIFFGGGNDSSTLSVAQYNEAVRSFLQPFIDTNTHIIMGRPGARRGGEDVMLRYEEILYAYAREKKLDFLNVRELFGGNYQSSVNGGYVMADGTHNSKSGCIKVANELLNRYGVKKWGNVYLNNEYPEYDKLQNIVDLGYKRSVVQSGATTELYLLGFRAPNNYCSIEVDIKAYRSGAVNHTHKVTRMVVNTGAGLNNVTAVRGVTTTDVYKFNGTSGSDIEFTVTATLENGLLSIKLTPTVTNNLDIITTCTVTFPYVTRGRTVWDFMELI